MTKTFSGIVTSVRSLNTAVVQVSWHVPHPLYKKLVAKSKKFKIETAGIELGVGDTVIIEETKPVSKDWFCLLTKSQLKTSKPSPSRRAGLNSIEDNPLKLL